MVYENGTMEWVDANLGSKITMKYPSCYLMEPGAKGEILSMAFAGPGQYQDSGGKMLHFASHTSRKLLPNQSVVVVVELRSEDCLKFRKINRI